MNMTRSLAPPRALAAYASGPGPAAQPPPTSFTTINRLPIGATMLESRQSNSSRAYRSVEKCRTERRKSKFPFPIWDERL